MSAQAPAPRQTTQPRQIVVNQPTATVAPTAGASYLATRKPSPNRLNTTNRTTPTLLRLMMAVSATLIMVFGLTTAGVMGTAHGTLAAGAGDTQQLLRIQNIQANLFRADATATNSFLVGGMETPAQAAVYQSSLDQAQTLMVEAAAAQPADREALTALSREIGHYRTTMQDARSANRQGLPVGTAYLNDATQKLRTDAMPIVNSLVEANNARVAQQTRGIGWILVLFTGLLALASLVYTAVLIALRFHRIINPGLALATALVLIGLIASLSLIGTANGGLQDVRTGSLATARYASTSRVQAYDAKANESLSLISRSRTGAYESTWNRASWLNRRALRNLPPNVGEKPRLQELWTDHVLSHRKIRDLDSDGLWNEARAEATGYHERSSNSTFAAFDAAVTKLSESAGDHAVEQLGATRPLMVTGVVVALLTSIAALVMAVLGINARLKEYA